MAALHRSILATAALCAALGGSGCLVAAAGAGVAGTAYVMGSVDADLNGTPPAIVHASESALEDLDMHIDTSKSTGLDGTVVATSALDTRVRIEVNRKDDKQSSISIRVGTFGDRDVAQQILMRIKSKL